MNSLTDNKNHKEVPSFALSLESEGGIQNVSLSDLSVRQTLATSMLEWPAEAFYRMRHLEPQVGCLNRCSFCSQSAGTTVWFLEKEQLANFMAALKYVAAYRALEWSGGGSSYLSASSLSEVFDVNRCFAPDFKMPSSGLLGYGRKEHRPGVLFCYLDNDICMYPYLDLFLMYAQQDLGVKIRVSSIGYSRHNRELQKMHEKIVSDFYSSLAGVRLSFSSYAVGWKDSKLNSQSEFVADIANFLKTYKPIFMDLGVGGRTACVEFRFRPLLQCAELVETVNSNHHTIDCGPYLLISEEENLILPFSNIVQKDEGRVEFDQPPNYYYMIYKNNFTNIDMLEILKDIKLKNVQTTEFLRKVLLYKMIHSDGYYYAVSQTPDDHNFFYYKQFYPKSLSRKKSGYIDSERYFLNALVAVKSKYEIFSWDQVDEVIFALEQKSLTLKSVDFFASDYINKEVIPLVKEYRHILEMASFSPDLFFDKNFTRDTGTICNLGRAYTEFRNFASRPNLPITPAHERSYGLRSSLASEGIVWRLSVAPFLANEKSSNVQHGMRNVPTNSPTIMLEELDLKLTSTESGQSVRRFWLQISEVQSVSVENLKEQYLIPGQRNQRHEK